MTPLPEACHLHRAEETAAVEGHDVRAVRVDEGGSEAGGPRGWEPDDKIPALVGRTRWVE